LKVAGVSSISNHGTQQKGDNMPKARSAALQKEINHLAAEIRLEHSKLEGAGKKDLLFIRKHLGKAAKAMKRNIRKAKPSSKGKKKSPVPGTPKQRSPRAKRQASAKTVPPKDGSSG